jgi:tetratricopeptide (TPR) repeat protein
VQKAANSRGTWNRYLTIGGKEYRPIDCYLEALKRDPEYAEAWCKLGSEITGMSEGEDTDKKLAAMDLFKDEPKITNGIGKLHVVHIDAAVFCFDKAIEIEPKNVEAWYEKGLWHNEWKNSEKEQIECFLEVTKLDPKHKEAWYHLANAYSKSYKNDEASKCYDKAITLSPDNLHVLYAKKAELLSGKDALTYYDKSLEIKPKYGYASYKKGILLESLSRYEEALECFENFSYEESKEVANSNRLHKQILRDKLKPNEDGSAESFEIYCRVLGNFFKDDELSEVELARKKLNENILQHIHKLDDNLDEDDFYERGEWLQNIGREKEALELYDEEIEKELEKGDLHMAAWANETKAYYFDKLGRTKDEFDCYEKTIQFCEKSRKDLTDDGAGYLSNAYARNAFDFHRIGNMDKAIEYIDHAIKLEREYVFDTENHWDVKVRWLSDEEAIKFLDEEIKAWQNSSYYDDYESAKKRYIEGMESSKNELLKKLAK